MPTIEAMLDRGVDPISINSRARAINAFLHWLYDEHVMAAWIKIPKLKEPEKDVRTFTPDQIRSLVSYKPRFFGEARAMALALLMADCGPRVHEAMMLTAEDIDFDNMLVHIRLGKGKKGRTVPISPEMRALLYRYLKKYSPPGPVFGTLKGTRASQQNILRVFKAICGRLGISGPRLSWHTLRHSMATQYIESEGDVFRLQQILGHSNIATTRKYVHLATKNLADVHHAHSLFAAAAR